MRIKCWAIISDSGAVQVRKNKPTINVNEVAVMLNFDIPDALFSKPRLVADIKIPEEAASQELITSEVAENVQELVEQVTGLNFRITVEKPEEDG